MTCGKIKDMLYAEECGCGNSEMMQPEVKGNKGLCVGAETMVSGSLMWVCRYSLWVICLFGTCIVFGPVILFLTVIACNAYKISLSWI